MGSLFMGEGIIPYVENMDLILDDNERKLFSRDLINGGGGWVETSTFGAELSFLGGQYYGSTHWSLPLSPRLFLSLFLRSEPLLLLNGELLGEASFPLRLTSTMGEVELRWLADDFSLGVAYSLESLGSTTRDLKNDGLWLDLNGDSTYHVQLGGELILDRWTLSGSVLTSAYDLSAESRYYTFNTDGSSDYDQFLFVDGDDDLTMIYRLMKLDADRGEWFHVGIFGESALIPREEDNRILLSAPSTIVSTSYVYRYVMDWNQLSYIQGGLSVSGRVDPGLYGLNMGLSLSYFSISGESDGLEVAGIFSPLLGQYPTQTDLGRKMYTLNGLLYRINLDMIIDIPGGVFFLSANQLIPQPFESESESEGVATTEISSGLESVFIWGGFSFSCGLSLAL